VRIDLVLMVINRKGKDPIPSLKTTVSEVASSVATTYMENEDY
jgi:hypothetical protein